MLGWAITFFLLSVIATVLGFGSLAGTCIFIAEFLTALFVLLFVAGPIYDMITGKRTKPPT